MAKRTDPANVITSATRTPSSAGGPKVLSNSHDIDVHADGALWDATANAFVKPEDTNYGKAH